MRLRGRFVLANRRDSKKFLRLICKTYSNVFIIILISIGVTKREDEGL